MSSPAAKRRRVDKATETLRKPFKSPLIRAPPTNSKPSEKSSPIAASASTTRERGLPTPAGAAALPSRSGAPPPKRQGSPLKSELLPQEGTSKSRGQAPTEELQANVSWKSKTGLERFDELTAKRDEEFARALEALKAAREEKARSRLATESSSTGRREAKLQELMVKWREASQQAADELFDVAKERVANLGGPKELRNMQRRQLEFYRSLDEPKSGRAETSSQGTAESASQAADGGSQEVTSSFVEKEEEGFTMAMMLQGLNIDLDVIGYDKVDECWK